MPFAVDIKRRILIVRSPLRWPACTPAEGWPSGQRQQTVNLPTYVYVGSNPTPSTRGTRPGTRCGWDQAGVAQW